jgi:hypothetical protein
MFFPDISDELPNVIKYGKEGQNSLGKENNQHAFDMCDYQKGVRDYVTGTAKLFRENVEISFPAPFPTKLTVSQHQMCTSLIQNFIHLRQIWKLQIEIHLAPD